MSLENTAIQDKPLFEQITPAKRRQVIIAVAFGTFMAPLDSSVVNIALPNISSHFQAPLTTVEWVVMAYLLMTSSLLLTFGRMGDMYGHKRIYLTGFGIFTAGSLLCALSPTILFLIFCRAVQAIGAGMMMSMGPAIVTDVTPPQERGKALGAVAVSVSVALAAGPVVGGFLTAKFGWPSIFYINLPIGIMAILLGQKVIPSTRAKEAQPFDIKGSVTIFTALIMLLLPLSYAERAGWSNPYILGSLAVGLALLVFFVYVENRIEFPMMDLSLFRNRLFFMSNLSALLSYMAMFFVFLLMPFYLQQLRHLSPAAAGLLLIPSPLTMMLVAPVFGAVSDRVDTRYISSLGMAIMTFGIWLISSLKVDSPVYIIIIGMIIIGMGSGMFQTPNNSAIMGVVPPNRRGIAASLLATMRNLGMVLGVAISGAVFSSQLSYLNKSLAAKGLSAAEVKVGAFTGAMHVSFLVAAAITAVAVVTSLIRGANKPVGR